MFNPRQTQADGAHGAGDDPDNDGLANRDESYYGTNPFDGDTEGDCPTPGRRCT
ncbi:MAG: hypothetical protein PHV28_03330 [Kiritimatiellae bacterium]|nr:hypothetical protein [Kiritimatiellia bacterium]